MRSGNISELGFYNNPLKAEELAIALEQYNSFFNKETIEYLQSILNLETSVLANEEINIYLRELTIFKHIAAYNILNKTKNTIESIPELEKNKIYMMSGRYFLTMNYHLNEKDSFCIFNSRLDNKKGFEFPFVHVFESDFTSKLKTLRKELEHISNITIGSDSIYSGEDEFGKPVFTPVYGGPNSRKAFEKQQKIESIKSEIEMLNRIGSKRDEIYNIVTTTLLKDWNQDLELNKEKDLGWVKIKKTSSIR